MKLWSQAIQVMLEQTLGIQMNLRMAVESIWFDDTKNGNYDLALGVIVSTLLDPSDYFRARYSADGPQNHSHWNNPKFDQLLLQIDREPDTGKRLALIRTQRRSWRTIRRCCRSAGRRSTMSGTTM